MDMAACWDWEAARWTWQHAGTGRRHDGHGSRHGQASPNNGPLCREKQEIEAPSQKTSRDVGGYPWWVLHGGGLDLCVLAFLEHDPP